jgi:hypothetical protein
MHGHCKQIFCAGFSHKQRYCEVMAWEYADWNVIIE